MIPTRSQDRVFFGRITKTIHTYMTLSLLAITTINHDLTWFAVNRTAQAVPCDKVVVMSDRKPEIPGSFYHIELPRNFGLLDYNIMVMKNLAQYIQTDHVLIVQYDGMATNSEFWSDSFLEYDYVGPAFSPWRYAVYHDLKDVPEAQSLYDSWPRNRLVTGSGGFSLRSRRLIQALCNDPEIQCPWSSSDYFIEDVLINFVYRDYLEQHHGIKFAPLEVSLAFGAEHVRNHDMSLGFHGWYNAPWFLEDEECVWYYDQLNHTNKTGFDHNYVEWLEAEFAAQVSGKVKTANWMHMVKHSIDPKQPDLSRLPKVARRDAIRYG